MRLWLLLLLLLVAGCDAGRERVPEALVLEAFLDTGRSLPEITVRRTLPLGAPVPEAAFLSGAEVVLEMGGTEIRYQDVPGRPGRYRPALEATVQPQAGYRLQVTAEGKQATATTSAPPPLTIDSLEIIPAARPVRAVLLDSLRLDSLGIGGREGFIYPVEVRVWWRTEFEETGPDSLYWIRTQLRPDRSFPSSVVDFFFPRETLLRERSLARDLSGRRSWVGVYAVPVRNVEDPLPVHRVRVAFVRGGEAYARFVASRQSPEQREPFTNVLGGLGIVAGISVDSVRVEVR